MRRVPAASESPITSAAWPEKPTGLATRGRDPRGTRESADCAAEAQRARRKDIQSYLSFLRASAVQPLADYLSHKSSVQVVPSSSVSTMRYQPAVRPVVSQLKTNWWATGS